MIRCGSQCIICDLPISYDTYTGCSHDCKYCFARKEYELDDIKPSNSLKALQNFIAGKRNQDMAWCDWNIPLHIGGMSDPFQPCEKKHRATMEMLKIMEAAQYPFVISTKGRLVADDEYIDILSRCNCVVQISAACDKYDRIEQGAPTFQERLEMISKLSTQVQRVIVRCQPYMHEVFKDVYSNLEKFKAAGAYGVIVEGLKMAKKKPGLVKVGGDWCYPYSIILQDFLKLKEKAHALGLKIYAGENRIRKYGDSFTCCGIDGLEGFKGNSYNLCHILNGDSVEPTEAQKVSNTGHCFRAAVQDTAKGDHIQAMAFSEAIMDYYRGRKEKMNIALGLKH